MSTGSQPTRVDLVALDVRHDDRLPPTLAFFPGASGSGAFWEPVATKFSRQCDVRLLSWPGAGSEPHDPAVGGYGDLISYAAGRVPVGCDVVQSMGGVVAIGLALTWPQKIRRLVLVATSGGLHVEANGAEDWRAEYRREFPAAAPWVTSERIDYAAQLARIAVPTCLIWGDSDPVSPLAIGRALDGALRTSVLHVIPRGSHMLAREHPDQVAALIRAHVG